MERVQPCQSRRQRRRAAKKLRVAIQKAYDEYDNRCTALWLNCQGERMSESESGTCSSHTCTHSFDRSLGKGGIILRCGSSICNDGREWCDDCKKWTTYRDSQGRCDEPVLYSLLRWLGMTHLSECTGRKKWPLPNSHLCRTHLDMASAPEMITFCNIHHTNSEETHQ